MPEEMRSERPERLSLAERRERTRGQLVAAAEDALVEDGFAATSLASVAERVGMTTGAVQRHFGTKSGLLLAVFDDVAARQVAATQALPAGQHGDTLHDRVHSALFAAWRGMDLEAVRVTRQLAEAARNDPALRAALRDHEADANEQIGAAIADSLGHNVDASVHFTSAMRLLTMLLLNLASAAPMDEREIDRLLTDTAALVADALLAGQAG